MINLHLIREPYAGNDYTRGELFVNDSKEPFCFTLEDRLRNKDEAKVYGNTAIPYGEYYGKLRFSPNKQRIVPQLNEVPGFTYVQIHAGNSIADTYGCILVGERIKGRPDIIWQSRIAERKLVELIHNHGNGIFKIKIS